ncbi:hypothetical protein M231_00408 [Tremella mesenterica]|uniref:BZIP domain-containing protein n=1 Tax=Tremella mesenterica TaxID=5217 RepID=A0A4Q1BWA6_TREME|nr:hypothetical protein M231_00408 [Tremella mesenterica]
MTHSNQSINLESLRNRPEPRGRKPNDKLPLSRAREVQRAFRLRRAEHLAALEERIALLENENSQLRSLLQLPLAERERIGSGPTGRGKSLKEGGVPMSERVRARKEARDRERRARGLPPIESTPTPTPGPGDESDRSMSEDMRNSMTVSPDSNLGSSLPNLSNMTGSSSLSGMTMGMGGISGMREEEGNGEGGPSRIANRITTASGSGSGVGRGGGGVGVRPGDTIERSLFSSSAMENGFDYNLSVPFPLSNMMSSYDFSTSPSNTMDPTSYLKSSSPGYMFGIFDSPSGGSNSTLSGQSQSQSQSQSQIQTQTQPQPQPQSQPRPQPQSQPQPQTHRSNTNIDPHSLTPNSISLTNRNSLSSGSAVGGNPMNSTIGMTVTSPLSITSSPPAPQPDLLARLKSCCHLSDSHVVNDPGLLTFAARLCQSFPCQFNGVHPPSDSTGGSGDGDHMILEDSWRALRSQLDPGGAGGADSENRINTGRMAGELVVRAAAGRGQGGWVLCRYREGMSVKRSLVASLIQGLGGKLE